MVASWCRAALLLLLVPLSHRLGHTWSLVHFVQVCVCPCAGFENVTREHRPWQVPNQHGLREAAVFVELRGKSLCGL